MKIAIVGGEGTGKSVLASALGAALTVPVLAPLKGELLAESGYHTLFEWGAATAEWPRLIERQQVREAAAGSCVIDSAAPELFCLVQRWAWAGLAPERSERLRAQTLAAATAYDRIVVMPPRVVAGPGPARFRSAAHNLQLTRLIDALVREAELGARTLVLADQSAEARAAQAIAFVR